MKKSNTTLPCCECLGFYSSKQLACHRIFFLRLSKRGGSQSDGQTKLVAYIRVDEKLKTEVFRLRADKILLVAKERHINLCFEIALHEITLGEKLYKCNVTKNDRAD